MGRCPTKFLSLVRGPDNTELEVALKTPVCPLKKALWLFLNSYKNVIINMHYFKQNVLAANL